MKRLIATALVVLCAALPFATVHAAESATPSQVEQTNGKLNINLADAATIAATLKGIGEKKAEAIVAYREQIGGSFSSLDQLLDVKGIGEKTLEKLKPQLTL